MATSAQSRKDTKEHFHGNMPSEKDEAMAKLQEQLKETQEKLKLAEEELAKFRLVCRKCNGHGKVLCWSCNTDGCGVCSGEKEVDCICNGGDGRGNSAHFDDE